MTITNKSSFHERATETSSVTAKKLFALMEQKQTNLALSADVTTSDELINLANQLGPEICMLKTHIDIIADFSPALTKKLRELADKHHFLIFEDRKFADIGNTVKHQYEGGIYKIVEWSDVVNAHSLPGPGIIEGLAAAGKKFERGLILLAEMSSQGNLMNVDYMHATLKMAKQHPDYIAGFITQHALSDSPNWINMTPGIKLETGTDALGQQYNTPESAILENGTDVIIVGRGIIKAADPQKEAGLYRQRAWDAYQRRTSSA